MKYTEMKNIADTKQRLNLKENDKEDDVIGTKKAFGITTERELMKLSMSMYQQQTK
jgi:hypothetical protein